MCVAIDVVIVLGVCLRHMSAHRDDCRGLTPRSSTISRERSNSVATQNRTRGYSESEKTLMKWVASVVVCSSCGFCGTYIMYRKFMWLSSYWMSQQAFGMWVSWAAASRCGNHVCYRTVTVFVTVRSCLVLVDCECSPCWWYR